MVFKLKLLNVKPSVWWLDLESAAPETLTMRTCFCRRVVFGCRPYCKFSMCSFGRQIGSVNSEIKLKFKSSSVS